MSNSQRKNPDDLSRGLIYLLEHLDRLLRVRGARVGNETFEKLVRPDPAVPDTDPWALLREGLLAIGHDLVRREESLDRAIAASSPETPVIALSQTGDWLVLIGERGTDVEVLIGEGGEAPLDDADRQFLTRSQLNHLLAMKGMTQHHVWGYVMPGLAMHALSRADDHAEDGDHHSPLKRLVQLVIAEGSDIKTVFVYGLVVGVLGLATPITVEALVNSVAFGGLLQPVIVLALVLAASLGLAAVLRALQDYVIELIQRRIFVRLVADLSARVPRVATGAFGSHYPPEMVNRFFDILTVQKIASKLLLTGVSILLSTTIGLLVLAFYHPILLAFDVVLVGCLVIIVFILGRGGVQTAIEESYAKYEVANWLQELARQPLLFKMSNGLEYAREEADRLATAYLDTRTIHYRVVFRQLAAALGLQVLASTLLLGLGGWLVKVGQLTLGQLVASWLIVSVVVSSVAKMGELAESWYDLLAAMDKIGSLLDLKLEPSSGGLLPRTNQAPSLAIRSASFGYVPEEAVVSNLELEFRSGELVGVSGPSGCGKSTLLLGICGLLPASRGFVEWGGEDLRDLNVHLLRQDISLAKPGFLLGGSLEDNLRAGRPWLTQAEIREALDAVDLLADIRALPLGLKTEVLTHGVPLSTGQQQRLILARALLGGPRLILIDGVLDSLGAAMRATIVERLRRSSQGRIIVIVSHCADVLGACDRTIELQGKESQS